MRRLENDYLETIIAVAIKTAPKTVKQGMRSKLPIARDEAVGHIAKHIADHISNDSTMVVQADLVGNIGNTGRAGVFGIDEPDPSKMTAVKRYQLDDTH